MKKLIVVILSLFILTGCNNSTVVNNSKVNNNESITKEQVVGNFTFSNISLIYEKGSSTFKVSVTNNTDTKLEVNKFNIILKTSSGDTITILNGYIGDEIEANTTIESSISSDIDLSEAYSVEFEIE